VAVLVPDQEGFVGMNGEGLPIDRLDVGQEFSLALGLGGGGSFLDVELRWTDGRGPQVKQLRLSR
jgi:hypothetical protein